MNGAFIERSPNSATPEPKTKQVLSACGIPVADGKLAKSAEEAAAAAELFGHLVVLKLHSEMVKGLELLRENLVDAVVMDSEFEGMSAIRLCP